MATGTAITPVGGRPVRETFLPFSPPSMGPEEEAEVIDTLRSGWITTGPKSQRFEAELAEYCGVDHAVAVNSCTAALHIALAALGIGEGDEVITTPFTFASSAHAVLYVGARPVFADICPDTFNIDPAQIEARITPRTRAIIPVDYGGHPGDMDAIMDIARRRDLKVVVDAAHSIGARFKGQKVGAYGDAVCLSFYATKNLTTGEGGALLTHDAALAHRFRIMSMYGISDARQMWGRYAPKGTWAYDVVELGFKYNFTDIQASLGLAQLRKLDRFLTARRQHAETYARCFSGCDLFRTPVERPEVRANYHLYPILLRLEALRIGRDEFIEYLKADNIGVSVLYIPLPAHSLYRTRLGEDVANYPVTDDVWRRIINLPISPKASAADIEDAAAAVLKIARHFAR